MFDQKSLDQRMLNKEMIIADLSENAKTVFSELCRFPCCLSILHFLSSNASTLLTADDVAYHLAKPIGIVEKDLATLAEFELVHTITVTGITFYRFATYPSKQKLAQELCTWQDRWETRIQEIAHVIWGTDSFLTFVAPVRASDSRTVKPIEKQNRNWVSGRSNILNGGENG